MEGSLLSALALGLQLARPGADRAAAAHHRCKRRDHGPQCRWIIDITSCQIIVIPTSAAPHTAREAIRPKCMEMQARSRRANRDRHGPSRRHPGVRPQLHAAPVAHCQDSNEGVPTPRVFSVAGSFLIDQESATLRCGAAKGSCRSRTSSRPRPLSALYGPQLYSTVRAYRFSSPTFAQRVRTAS